MASGIRCFPGLEFDIRLCTSQVEERDVCPQAYLVTAGNIPWLFPLSEAHEPLSFTCGISTGSTKMTSPCLGPGLGATLGVRPCPWMICISIRHVRAETLPSLSELALLSVFASFMAEWTSVCDSPQGAEGNKVERETISKECMVLEGGGPQTGEARGRKVGSGSVM